AVSRLITSGALAPGDRLPTVRELAHRLGISPTTVGVAWRTLADVGAIDARGRRGTFVVAAPRPFSPPRYRRVTEGPGHFPVDRHARPGAPARPAPGSGARRGPHVDDELPRRPGGARARRGAAGDVAVPARSADGRRRRDGRPRPHHVDGGTPRRPRPGRTPV